MELLNGVLEAKTKEDATILLEIAVPCILHLENRVSECLIRMLLLKALLYVEDDNHALNYYILQVEKYMNESIFREPDAPSVWKFPHEENKLGDVKFSNWWAQRIIEEFHHLVDLSIPEKQMLTCIMGGNNQLIVTWNWSNYYDGRKLLQQPR
jgi:hypothetical protein